jgi:hypothetical protein
MKNLIMAALMVCAFSTQAQFSGSVFVAGDINRFYPVTWTDGGWNNNEFSEIIIGRSSIHENASLRGSLMSTFRYHTTTWGNLSNYIDAEIYQDFTPSRQFIAGWRDATGGNASNVIIIWLRGGGNTYYYKSKHAATAVVYDGVANALPYQELNGPAHTYKTAIDAYVNTYGMTKTGTAYFLGTGMNLFNGNVAIGTSDTKGYKLAVGGSMIAESVKVKLQGTWPDFVFAKKYKLPSLAETEAHINVHGHLPGIPSAAEVSKGGIELGDMNKKLLQKIEELTLYLIEMKKENEKQNKEIENLQTKLK